MNQSGENEQPKQTPTEASKGFLEFLGKKINGALKDNMLVMSGSFLALVASGAVAGAGIEAHSLLPIALGAFGIGGSGSVMLNKAEFMNRRNQELTEQVSSLESQKPGINRTSTNSTLQQK